MNTNETVQIANANSNEFAIPQHIPTTPQLPKNQPEHILNTTQTDPEQTLNEPRTEAEQTLNPSRTNPEPASISPQIPQRPDPDLAQIEEEIVEHTHAKSPLDNLPHDQQALLYDLLCRHQYRQVKSAIALPPPNGLGVNASLGALFNFKRRYAKRDQTQKKLEIGRIACEIIKEPAVADEGYVTAAERLLKIRLLEAINNPSSKTSEIRDLYQTLIRLRAQSVAEKRLKLDEQKINKR